MPLERRPDGALFVVTGATRSGKTIWTRQDVRAAVRAIAGRVLVWDVEGQWATVPGYTAARSPLELVRLVRSRSAQRIAYIASPTAEAFAFFCRVAWQWVLADLGAVIVEELADVTTPGKAPEAWGLLVRRGLKYGARIYAITQRPSESDKTIMGNWSTIHCHRMARAEDRKYMAREMDLPLQEIESLQPLEFVEKHADGSSSRGRVKPPRRRAA